MEGLARFVDDYIEAHQSEPGKCLQMKCYFREFLALFGFVLPCVYCRISYRELTHPGYDESTNVEKLLNMKNGAKLFVYNLHNCVNYKLHTQESRAAKTQEEKVMVDEKWRAHSLAFCDVHFIRIVDFAFWEAFCVFFGYVMCDFREHEKQQIVRLLECIGKMLRSVTALDIARDNLSQVYDSGLTKLVCLSKHWESLDKRIDSVWALVIPVFRFFGWQPGFDLVAFQKICENGIVEKCVKTQK
jgi:hypothetical protein